MAQPSNDSALSKCNDHVKDEENVPNLLAKIAKYETESQSTLERIKLLENELKKKNDDLISLKKQLEEQIAEAEKIKTQNAKEAEEIAALKFKSEDTLTRAKSMIFDKTKVIKNQELQIEALNQQITSLKEVVAITKDLLEIRNLEVNQLETKMKCMEDKISAEKERHDLMHKKLEHMIRYNGDLKREYETQLCLFSALRERYNERELAKGIIADTQSNTTPRVTTTIESPESDARTSEIPESSTTPSKLPESITAASKNPESSSGTSEIRESSTVTSEISKSNNATSEIAEPSSETSVIPESGSGTSVIPESGSGTSVIPESSSRTSVIPESSTTTVTTGSHVAITETPEATIKQSDNVSPDKHNDENKQ